MSDFCTAMHLVLQSVHQWRIVNIILIEVPVLYKREEKGVFDATCKKADQ